MSKHLISAVVFILVLALFYNELSKESLYSADTVTQLHQQALKWAKAGEHERALLQLEKLHTDMPENQHIFGDYLIVLIQSGQESKALALAKQKGIAVIPLYAYKDLFLSALEQKDDGFAKRLAESEIQQSENVAEVAINRAASFSEFGYEEHAINLLTFAKPYSGQDALSLDIMRLALLSKTEPWLAQQEAELLFAERGVNHIDAWKIYKDYWVQQGQQGNLKQAIDQLRKYKDDVPGELRVEHDLLVLLAWNGEFAEAEHIYDELPNKHELPEYVRAASAQTLYKRGRLSEARDAYQDLHEEFPNNEEYRNGLAKVYVDLNQPEEALFLLQPASAPMGNDTLIIMGLAQQQLGHHEQALSALTTAIQSKNQEDDNAYFAWADSLERVADQKGISSVWPQYSVPLSHAPDSIKVRVQNLLNDSERRVSQPSRFNIVEVRREAAVARQKGNTQQAIRLYQYGLSRAPNDRELRLGLALVYTDIGENNHAKTIFNELFAQYPANKEILDAGVYYAQRFNKSELQAEILRRLITVTSGKEQKSYIKTWLALIYNNDYYPDDQAKIAELNQLRRFNNNDISLALAGIYYHADQCADTREVLSTLLGNNASAKLLESAGYLLRSCGYSRQALLLYQEGMDRFPHNYVFVTGAILTLTDLQRYQEAEILADRFSARFEYEQEFFLAKAYLYFSQNNYQASLALYQQVLDKNPEHREAYVGWVLSLAELAQADAAFIHAQEKAALFSDDDWKRLYELRSVQMVRNAEVAPLQDRVPIAEKALISLDEQIDFLVTQYPDDTASYRDATLNKVRVLTLADQAYQAVLAYEALSLPKEEVPTWGLAIAAEAYLKNRQPAKAIELGDYAASQYKDDLNILSIIFFAYIDLEDYKNAGEMLDRMNLVIKGQEIGDGRAHWVARLDAMFEAYQNRLGLAEKLLKDLKQQAPNDPEIDMNLATIYRWRGWANKSLQTLDEIPEGAVDNVALKASKANALLDQYSYTSAENIINKLVDNYEFHPDVKNIDERWRIHNLRQYTADIIYGESSGNTFGNEELLFEQRLYSSPIQNHYRVYGRHRYNYAEFPEGNGYLNRIGIGGEYRSKFLDATLEVNASTRDSSDPGVSLGAVWKLDDYLSISADMQTYSDLTPLRAINDDVEAGSLVLGARYRWNENRFASIAAGLVDFDDGNDRKFIFLKHQHGIYQSAYHQWSLSQEFYASENDEVDAFYYNPEEDYSFRGAAIYDGLIWRRYEKEWTHRLTLGVGNYKQKEESNAGIWDLEYIQRWQLDPTLEIRYGYIHRRRTYDGDAESFNAGIANINWRF